MSHKALPLLLLVWVFQGSVSADISFRIVRNPNEPNKSSAMIPTSLFTFDAGNPGQQMSDPNNTPQVDVTGLLPFINQTTNEFEMVIDYYDGGLRQTITNGGVGLAFNQVRLRNSVNTIANLSLSSSTILSTTFLELYSWDSNVRLNSGLTTFNNPFTSPQDLAQRKASILARFRPQAGVNLANLNPTALEMSGNWFVRDDSGQVSFTISSVPSSVPEPGSMALVSMVIVGGFGLRNHSWLSNRFCRTSQ